MEKMKVLGLLVLVAVVVWYLWSEDKPEVKPSLPKNKSEIKPFGPSSVPKSVSVPKSIMNEPKSKPNIVPRNSPRTSDLVKSEPSSENKSVNLPSIETVPKPNEVNLPGSEWTSELNEAEKLQRKEQEQADYEWLLKNKTLREWYLEKKLSGSQYAVLSSKVSEELMAELEYFEGLLPKHWEWMVSDFKGRGELVEEWIRRGFSYEQAKDWVRVGLGAEESEFARWLRDRKGVSAEWVLNFGDFEGLKREFEKHVN